MLKAVIKYEQGTAQYYIEDLGNGVELEMVLIPAGTFIMGAPENEEGSRNRERPQHQVTVPTFFMGRYQVTQAQWEIVANLPQVERELKAQPSKFKGDNLPVESVSWYDAVEFCTRLSNHTGRNYRLPSEAEWEYACRAGTTTPFNFGETITTDLANYRGTDNEEFNWSGSYSNGLKGTYREKTTPVGSFDATNAFGLSDMHGNVWEWCFDDYHKSYERVPTDGSAWVKSENKKDNNNRYRILRGGSCDFNPGNCRSAYRLYDNPDGAEYYSVGLRVVCSIAP
ncbi:MAG: formylglycine-generating enzyme family protein [Richelia sp. RM1_1_1]|nr:formylglycine-generating enzyme family protein [Richelia sp. SM1_7_0]NJN09399.1 formylglycine-generating enzyme family protein [Richelia sp. RM1_1_1]